MTTQLRLAWRLQRWEMAFVTIACLVLSGVAFWLANDMRSVLANCGTTAATHACDVTYAFQDSHGTAVQLTQMAITFVPFVGGLVLGVPVVAREVEHRTALISWPLSGSRVRWLAWRMAPVFVVTLALVSVLAVAADQMAHAYFPHSDLGFQDYEYRGLPLVMRTLLILVSGVAIGALLGRTLPALLVGIGLSVAVSIALGTALPRWVPSTELSIAQSVMSGPGSINTDLKYRTPDGRLVDGEEGDRLLEAAYGANPGHAPDPSTLPQEVFYGIAASRYPEVLVRETAAIGLAVFALGALAAAAVARRRPE